ESASSCDWRYPPPGRRPRPLLSLHDLVEDFVLLHHPIFAAGAFLNGVQTRLQVQDLALQLLVALGEHHVLLPLLLDLLLQRQNLGIAPVPEDRKSTRLNS